MGPLDDEERAEAALTAVADLVQRIDPGAMVTRFVLLVEAVDMENQRAFWSLVPPDCKPWDSLGLIEFARVLEFNSNQL